MQFQFILWIENWSSTFFFGKKENSLDNVWLWNLLLWAWICSFPWPCCCSLGWTMIDLSLLGWAVTCLQSLELIRDFCNSCRLGRDWLELSGLSEAYLELGRDYWQRFQYGSWLWWLSLDDPWPSVDLQSWTMTVVRALSRLGHGCVSTLGLGHELW